MLGRVVGTIGLAGLLFLAGSGLSGCIPGSADLGSNSIDGIRSDPDHQGLVVSYLGGLCDKSARLVVTETPTRLVDDRASRRVLTPAPVWLPSRPPAQRALSQAGADQIRARAAYDQQYADNPWEPIR